MTWHGTLVFVAGLAACAQNPADQALTESFVEGSDTPVDTAAVDEGNTSRPMVDDTPRSSSAIKMMLPEILADVLVNSFGAPWYYHYEYNSTLQERNLYVSPLKDTKARVYMGGIDSASVTVRPDTISVTAPLVMRRLAREYCYDLFTKASLNFVPNKLDDPADDNNFSATGSTLNPDSNRTEIEKHIDRFHKLVRSKPVDAETLAIAFNIYEQIYDANSSTPFAKNYIDNGQTKASVPWAAWIGVCDFLFLIEGGFVVY